MDEDFQERMFARQIAVMKGQAWNVVETLKTPDHGPLELTRRAKVCVWDDLVDVPVAVPMRAASAEMRRRATVESDEAAAAAASVSPAATIRAASEIIAEEEEEMDIGAATASTSAPNPATAAVVDLLGNPSPPADLPHPGRFELALQDDIPSPGGGGAEENGRAARPRVGRNNTGAREREGNVYSPDRGGAEQRQKRFSFTASPQARRETRSIAAQLYGEGHGGSSRHAHAQQQQQGGYSGRASFDFGALGGGGEQDEEEMEGGDLGYAAASGMEGNRRKVIVERLEMVKGRNPVFTWC